jgi:antitoxin HigA-1
MTTEAETIYEYPNGVPLAPVHPGRTLASELAARGLSANALALKLRVPSNRLSEIVRGQRGVTAETALRLGRFFGTGGAFWINLQAQYDLALAHRELGARIAKEVDDDVSEEISINRLVVSLSSAPPAMTHVHRFRAAGAVRKAGAGARAKKSGARRK